MKDHSAGKSCRARVQCQVFPYQILSPGHSWYSASHPATVKATVGGWGTAVMAVSASLCTLWIWTELWSPEREQNNFINQKSANSECGGLNFYKSSYQNLLITWSLSKNLLKMYLYESSIHLFFLYEYICPLPGSKKPRSGQNRIADPIWCKRTNSLQYILCVQRDATNCRPLLSVC